MEGSELEGGGLGTEVLQSPLTRSQMSCWTPGATPQCACEFPVSLRTVSEQRKDHLGLLRFLTLAFYLLKLYIEKPNFPLGFKVHLTNLILFQV